MPTIRVLVDERCDRLVANRSVFGSALNHHVHLHACLTNGVFVPAADDAERDAPPAFLPARPITQPDLATIGVWLGFYQEKVPDPFWAQGERDRHRLLTQTEPVPAAAAIHGESFERKGRPSLGDGVATPSPSRA